MTVRGPNGAAYSHAKFYLRSGANNDYLHDRIVQGMDEGQKAPAEAEGDRAVDGGEVCPYRVVPRVRSVDFGNDGPHLRYAGSTSS